jgi:hypothetical protein
MTGMCLCFEQRRVLDVLVSVAAAAVKRCRFGVASTYRIQIFVSAPEHHPGFVAFFSTSSTHRLCMSCDEQLYFLQLWLTDLCCAASGGNTRHVPLLQAATFPGCACFLPSKHDTTVLVPSAEPVTECHLVLCAVVCLFHDW